MTCEGRRRSRPLEMCLWSSLFLPSAGREGAADHDVAESRLGAHLDRVLVRVGTVHRVHAIAYIPEARVDVEPRGHAVNDPDIHLAHSGFGEDWTASHSAEADVSVGRLGCDSRMRFVDNDLAVGRAHAEVAGNLADPRVAVGVLENRSAVYGAYPNGTRAGGDL